MATPDRWAPWIEPSIRATANLLVNAAAYALVPGVSVTFTPHIATRISVAVGIEWEVTVAGASYLITELFLNGVGQNKLVVVKSGTLGDRHTSANVFGLDLAKETTYTLELKAVVDVVAATYLIVGTRTGLLVTGLPNLHT